MGDEAQPATSILVQTVCTKVLRVERWRSRIRRAAAKVTHPKGAASSRLGVPSKGFFGRRGGLMVSELDSGASGPGSSPGRGHCVVFLGKTLYSHSASLHPGV